MSKPEDSGLLSTQLRPSAGPPDRPCLEEEEVLAFLDGRLGEIPAQSVEAHVDLCTACRQLLAFMAKVDGGPGPRAAPEPEASPGIFGAGQRIDHFEIERILGRGGMGEIYLAEDLQLRRKIALKVIAPGLLDSAEANERFLVEARATARFNHPHIVTIHSVGSHQGRPYLALELVEGETLKARIDRGPIPLLDALRIARAIASALDAAHAHQVLHRDLKPQNVMLGKDGRPRVLDFGLAKLFPEAGKGTRSLFDTWVDGAKDTLRGTPGYMAPEQWKKEPVGSSADVWALGVIFYELVSGARPYQESSPISYAMKVNEAGPAPRLPRSAAAPDSVERLIAACLEKAPADRPTANAVVDALDELLGDESLKLAADLQKAAERWEANGQPARTLWDRQRLESAQEILEKQAFPLAAPAAKFLSASMRLEGRRAEDKRRRLTFTVLGLTAAALVLTGLTQQAISRRALAESERVRAQRAEASALLEGARSALAKGEPLEARAKLVSAFETADSPGARLFAWQLTTEPLLAQSRLGTGLYDLAVSPDGTSVAVAAQDRTVYLHDAQLGNPKSLRGHGDQVMELAFSPDGRTLASAGWSGELRLFRLDDRTARVVSTGPKKTGLAFSPDGTVLAATTNEGKLELYPEDGGAPKSMALQGVPADLAFRDDGKAVLTADRDGEVRVYDTRDGALQLALHDADATAPAVVVAIAGKNVAVGREDGTVALFGERGEVLRRFSGHDGAVERIRFGPDDAIYSAGVDGSVMRHEPTDGHSEMIVRHDGGVWGLALGPGPIVYSAGLDGVVKGSRPFAKDRGLSHSDAVAAVAFAGKDWLSGGYDRRVLRWSSGRAKVIDDGSRGTIYGLATTKDRWASASLDQWVRLGRLDRSGEVKALAGHSAGVYAVGFSPDGKILASAGSDRTVRLWDGASGEAITVLRGHEGPVFALAFSIDGKTLATGGADKAVRLWSIGQSGAPKIFQGATGSIRALAFSPDGRGLAVTGYDGVVRIHDVKTGAPKIIGRHEGRAYAVAFAPDGRHLASAGADGVTRIWSLDDPSALTLLGHRGEINALAYSPDGQVLVTGGDDGTVRRYDPTTGVRLDRPAILGDVGEGLEQRLNAGVVAIAEGRGAICVSDLRSVERWAPDGRRFTTPLAGATTVAVRGEGCAALVAGTLYELGKDGAYAERATGVDAFGVEGDRLLWATGDRAVVQEANKTFEVPIDPGATAITLVGDALYLGYANGAIEVGRSDDPSRGIGLGKVLRLAAIHGVLAAGRENGRIDLYDLVGGAHLHSTRLHGPITALFTDQGEISAGSELGDVWRGPVGLDRPWCAWLKDVWRAHPLAFSAGSVIERSPPKDHPCSAR